MHWGRGLAGGMRLERQSVRDQGQRLAKAVALTEEGQE